MTLRRVAVGGGVVAGLWVACGLALDVTGSLAAPAAPADVIVVAGCQVDPGGVPSACLAGRVDAAVRLFQEGVAPRLLLTGGAGVHPPTEAEAGAARAREAGVPSDAMILETRSTSTWQNAAFGLPRVPGARLVVVTDTFHVARARRCFASRGADVSALGVRAPLPRRAWGALREVLAVAWYGLRGRCRKEA